MLSNKSADAYHEFVTFTVDDFLEHSQKDNLTEWCKKHFNEHYPIDTTPPCSMIHDVLISKYLSLCLAVLECDNCGRLWVQSKPAANHYVGYSPDEVSQKTKVLGYNESDSL